ncbi:hypothetical protein LCGC14_2016540 [marine sediment metagenome]|uniref:Uncharacterized protein n=1 Tax=marine sediment metagenome TaxID=412755 RepID=A0A0F9EZ04_9ZZZZ
MSNPEINETDIIKAQIKQEQQKIDNDPNAIYADSLKEERGANLLDQINPDKLLSDIEHRIRGEKKDEYSKKWIPYTQNQKPVSEALIANFMSFLGATLNQNTSMSNFAMDEINEMMILIIRFVKDDLTVNDVEYDIVEDYTEMTRIGIIICSTCFATFKQALNGGLSRRLFATLKVSGNLNDEPKASVGQALAFWK